MHSGCQGDDRTLRLACIFFSLFQVSKRSRHQARCERPGKASPDRTTADFILTILHWRWCLTACTLSLTPVVFDRRQTSFDLNLKRQLRRWDRALVAAEASKVAMTRCKAISHPQLQSLSPRLGPGLLQRLNNGSKSLIRVQEAEQPAKLWQM
ncbi:hypothetical protein WJX79_001289 [Trebouxia sp. C0005]